VHEAELTYYNWEKFSEEEWHLCPPVVAVGGDGAMYDIGFQNLSRALMTGMPVKIMVVDTQVYSNTGGQACTSGFISQVADMSPYGKQDHGKKEIRKEISLIGMAHRSAFVSRRAPSNPTHLIESYIDGLNSRRPALFNIYAVCPPEHGVGDDMSVEQSKLAVESRAYPLFRYDPETWNDTMVPVHEFLDLAEDERDGLHPYVWGVDGKNRLMRVLVAQELIHSCEERRSFWTQLRGLCGELNKVDVESVRQQAKAEIAQKLTSSLLALAVGEGGLSGLAGAAPSNGAGHNGNGAAHPGANGSGNDSAEGWEPVWVETPECTACDECVTINPKIFKYNGDKKIEIVDPKGGPYKDIVKAAEKCAAGCIHPGMPWNPAEAGVDKLVKRAEKYQ
jgi:ferredoxin